MQLGDFTTAERDQRSPLNKALDRFDAALTDLISTAETGGFDQLHADQQVAVWQRFERIRNKLPLVDHQLITAADTADVPREYCSATMTQFLVPVLQLTPGEAAARVRAAAAVGPRTTMLGEQLAPQLPQLAALQREGVVSAAKVQIVERALHTLTRPSLDPQAVATAERLLTHQAAILAPAELHRFAQAVVAAADPDGPEPVDDQLQHDRRPSGVDTAAGRHVASPRQTHHHRRRAAQRHHGPTHHTPQHRDRRRRRQPHPNPG